MDWCCKITKQRSVSEIPGFHSPEVPRSRRGVTLARPFRFGVQTYDASSSTEWRDKAQRAEALGYSTLLLADHYLGPGLAMESAQHPPQGLAAVPAMMAAAGATKSLRVGARVLGLDYHQPVVLAKELMTIDLLSSGRLEIGLGAGWLRSEYEAMGIRFDSPSRRIDRLEGLVRFLKAYMGHGQITWEGNDGVKIEGFEGVPKPVQQPRPPIMIGGGAKRILELAAREADIVSFNFDNRSGRAADPQSVGSAVMTERIEWVRRAAGDRFDDLELDIGAYFVSVGESATSAARDFIPLLGHDPDDVIEHPHALVGSVAEICEQVERRRKQYGLSYIVVFDHDMERFAPVVERLAGR